ncbi:14661_t:CDS:1, partial [Gigaspora rosea]
NLKLTNLKVTITGLDSDKQGVEFEASAMIKNLEVKVFAHNEKKTIYIIYILSKIVETILDATKI